MIKFLIGHLPKIGFIFSSFSVIVFMFEGGIARFKRQLKEKEKEDKKKKE